MDSVADALTAHLGGEWALEPQGSSGFCATWRAQSSGSRARLFVKSARIAQGEVLHAEADGLAALAQADCIRTPAVEGCWVDASLDLVVLALQWLDLAPGPGRRFGEQLGRQLGTLHLKEPAEGNGRFGWRRDNWLGGTPQ